MMRMKGEDQEEKSFQGSVIVGPQCCSIIWIHDVNELSLLSFDVDFSPSRANLKRKTPKTHNKGRKEKKETESEREKNKEQKERRKRKKR